MRGGEGRGEGREGEGRREEGYEEEGRYNEVGEEREIRGRREQLERGRGEDGRDGGREKREDLALLCIPGCLPSQEDGEGGSLGSLGDVDDLLQSRDSERHVLG